MTYRILVDGSGSMLENGKDSLVHLALVSFRHFLESGLLQPAPVVVVRLSSGEENDSPKELDFAACCDFPDEVLHFSGTGIHFRLLRELLRGFDANDRVLILSDGWFDSRIVSVLLDWQSLTPAPSALRIVRIGPHCGNGLTIGALSPFAFDLDELATVLDPWRNTEGGEP